MVNKGDEVNHSHFGLLFLFAVLLVSQAAINPVPAQSQPTLSLDPAQYSTSNVDETFSVNITIRNAQNVWGWVAAVTWNPEYISPIGEPVEGNFLKKDGATLFQAALAKNGYIPEIYCSYMLSKSASGEGTLATLTFKVIKKCIETPITIVNTTLYSPEEDPQNPPFGYKISHTIASATTKVSLIVGSAPIANAGEDQTVAEGTSVTFDGSKTYPANESLTYTWNFVDESPKTLNGATVAYTFNIPGVYTVTLTVANSNGEQSEAKITITVTDITPPVPVILVNNQEPGSPLPVNQRIEFSGCNSYDPEGGRIREYRWQFEGEPSFDVNATHIFATAGIYDVSLTVFDLRGNNSSTKNIKLTVGTSSNQDSVQGNSNGSGNQTGSADSGGGSGGGGGGGSFDLSPSFTLPPLAIGILATLTVATLAGSAFWLRKRTSENT